jgi:hypothetical protein
LSQGWSRRKDDEDEHLNHCYSLFHSNCLGNIQYRY